MRVARRRRRLGSRVRGPGPGARPWSVGLGGPGRARGAGAWDRARSARGRFRRSLDVLLFRRVPQGGRHDGPGPEPPRAAPGDFGRPRRLLWRADRRLPLSDEVRPAGREEGRGVLVVLGGSAVGVGYARLCVLEAGCGGPPGPRPRAEGSREWVRASRRRRIAHGARSLAQVCVGE